MKILWCIIGSCIPLIVLDGLDWFVVLNVYYICIQLWNGQFFSEFIHGFLTIALKFRGYSSFHLCFGDVLSFCEISVNAFPSPVHTYTHLHRREVLVGIQLARESHSISHKFIISIING